MLSAIPPERRAGILAHPTSLPGEGPCGDIGPGAVRFLEWLQAAGCTLWQVLPLNPPGLGFSPYASLGAFACATQLLSVDRLVEDGLLSRSELGCGPPSGPRVQVPALARWHAPRVARAARRLTETEPHLVADFAQAHPYVRDWARWRTRGRSRSDRARLSKIEVALQLLFRRQWDALRAEAARRGILLVGDVPIFVGARGADVWAHPDLFRLDRNGRPDPAAGVPPDAFSPRGQRWGNPHYAWDRHRSTRFRWWTDRFRFVLQLCDAVRVDHFRGFCAAWEVPAADRTARRGRWAPGPGRALFDAVRKGLGGLPLVVEDLGFITPDVDALRDGLGLCGTKVLQFAFGAGADPAFLPCNWTHDRWVVYTGTHDNDTTRGWWRVTSSRERRQLARHAGPVRGGPHRSLIRLAWESRARWALAPLQDALGLGSEARMNVPGRPRDNWRWRATALPDPDWLREIARETGRLAGA